MKMSEVEEYKETDVVRQRVRLFDWTHPMLLTVKSQ